MSYQIIYSGKNQREPRKKNSFGFVGVAAIFAVWFLVYTIFFPKQAQNFREIFFPFGSPEVQTAFSNLTEELREGTSFEDAAQAFCLELIYGTEEAH